MRDTLNLLIAVYAAGNITPPYRSHEAGHITCLHVPINVPSLFVSGMYTCDPSLSTDSLNRVMACNNTGLA